MKPTKSNPQILKDEASVGYTVPPSSMVRTQIYLTREEHEFLTSEAARRNEPMAAVIRAYVDEKMRPAENIWEDNSLLSPAADAPGWQGREDGSINHDFHAFGGTPKYKKSRGKWVPGEPQS